MTRYKQPGEQKPIGVDFSPWLPTGETLQGTSDVKIYDSTGADVTATMLQSKTIAHPYIDGLVKAGTHLSDYKITFIAITQFDRFEYDITLKVREQ